MSLRSLALDGFYHAALPCMLDLPGAQKEMPRPFHQLTSYVHHLRNPKNRLLWLQSRRQAVLGGRPDASRQKGASEENGRDQKGREEDNGWLEKGTCFHGIETSGWGDVFQRKSLSEAGTLPDFPFHGISIPDSRL